MGPECDSMGSGWDSQGSLGYLEDGWWCFGVKVFAAKGFFWELMEWWGVAFVLFCFALFFVGRFGTLDFVRWIGDLEYSTQWSFDKQNIEGLAGSG